MDRRAALPLHRHQLPRPPDAERPRAHPQDRVQLVEPGLRPDHHRVPHRLRGDADGLRPHPRPRSARATASPSPSCGTRPWPCLTSLATGLRSFCAFRFLLGAGEAANWPGATKAVSEWFPRRQRGWAVALFDSGSSVGAAVAPALVLLLMARFGGWRPAFVIAGLLGFLWVILWRRSYHPPETHPRITEAERAMILADHAAEHAEAPPEKGERAAPLVRAAAPPPDVGGDRRQRPHRPGVVHDRGLVRDLPRLQGLLARADRGRLLGALPRLGLRQLLRRRLLRAG